MRGFTFGEGGGGVVGGGIAELADQAGADGVERECLARQMCRMQIPSCREGFVRRRNDEKTQEVRGGAKAEGPAIKRRARRLRQI